MQDAHAEADIADSRDGNLPLHLAASVGRLDLVQRLVQLEQHSQQGGVESGARTQTSPHATVDRGGGSAGGGDRATTTPDQQRSVRPRSYVQRQNRWGCTPHDLAFIDDHREVVKFLQQCSDAVETQHVLDRNVRLEVEDAHRQRLEVGALGVLRTCCGLPLS